MYSAVNGTDEFIAEQFKKDFNEQFFILVRMHLSFLLDLNTSEAEFFSEKGKLKKLNITHFGKKAKMKGIMEGAPLTQEGISQVYQLIEFLKVESNIKTEGIFRKSGSIERQQELKSLLNQGVTIQFESGAYSVHDCASVLKSFLADLPEPLLTEAHFPFYCQIAESCGVATQSTQPTKLLEALQLLLLLLPSENKTLFKDIIELLHFTASFESSNRMSLDGLSKMFTPHLLFPRKMAPESLLKESASLFAIVRFIIERYQEIFKIPHKLILDFRAKYEKKRALSPTKILNESINDAASTVFTFVDQARTAKENESNPTETALAQLYAHIQSLPESSKKRKLVKQFNKENGNGTPLQVIRSGPPKSKSIGDSIKKHFFQKALARKKGFQLRVSSSDEMLGSPTNSQSIITRARLFCHHNCDNSAEDDQHSAAKKLKTDDSESECASTKRSLSDSDLGKGLCNNVYSTSTPACLNLRNCTDIFTPDEQDRNSVSPITRSTQKMTRAMQETMMTPRSRKPVLLVSGTNINTLNVLQEQAGTSNISSPMNDVMETSDESVTDECGSDDTPEEQNYHHSLKKSKSESELLLCTTPQKMPKINKSDDEIELSDTFKVYLSNRGILTFPQVDSSFSSRTDDFNSTDFKDDKMSDSLLYCLDGNEPNDDDVVSADVHEEKKLVLKPKQFDEDGKPIIFETSF